MTTRPSSHEKRPRTASRLHHLADRHRLTSTLLNLKTEFLLFLKPVL